MTTSLLTVAGLEADASTTALIDEIVSAAKRALKADPGDFVDVRRYETLCVQLEKLAENARSAGRFSQFEWTHSLEAPGFSFERPGGVDVLFGTSLLERLDGEALDLCRSWISQGNIVVASCDPMSAGSARERPALAGPKPPADPWKSKNGETGKRAVIERFRSQLNAAVEHDAAPKAVNPGGIHNQVITEVLREHVVGSPTSAIKVPVVYGDGSQSSNGLTLKCLDLVDTIDGQPDLELSLTLLSIRHTEMDPVVDGAWLRNAEVSRPRQAALTDDFVYSTSMSQLEQLTQSGQRRVLIRLYQTGLDTAIIGFYRAIIEQLLAHPTSIGVIPMFFSNKRTDEICQDQANFVEGAPWALSWKRANHD